MSGNECPHCRGDLIDNIPYSVWQITFATLTSTAAGLHISTFEINATLDDDSAYGDSLGSVTPVVSGNETIYSWTISSPGSPVTATLEVEHGTLGVLEQVLEVSEQSAAA